MVDMSIIITALCAVVNIVLGTEEIGGSRWPEVLMMGCFESLRDQFPQTTPKLRYCAGYPDSTTAVLNLVPLYSYETAVSAG